MIEILPAALTRPRLCCSLFTAGWSGQEPCHPSATLHSTLYTVVCTVYSLLSTVYCWHYTVYCWQFTVYSTHVVSQLLHPGVGTCSRRSRDCRTADKTCYIIILINLYFTYYINQYLRSLVSRIIEKGRNICVAPYCDRMWHDYIFGFLKTSKKYMQPSKHVLHFRRKC